VVLRHGVTLSGYTDLPSRLARQSSTLYATNLLRLAEELCKSKDGRFNVNMDDEVIRGTTVIKDGAITWPPPAAKALGRAAEACGVEAATAKTRRAERTGIGADYRHRLPCGGHSVLVHRRECAGRVPRPFHVFVLACFVGYMVIWNVTPALHTR